MSGGVRLCLAALAAAASLLAAGSLARAQGVAPKDAQGGATARAPEAAPAALPTWFAMALAHSELGINVSYFWSKGPMLRAETVVAGHGVVSIVAGDTYYAYDAIRREGVAIGRSRKAIAQDAPGRRPFGREREVILAQGGELVGEEALGGHPVERYRVTDAAGRREVWVTKDALRLPVRLEIFTRAAGRTISTDFVNWASALPIDDAFFAPDPGIRLTRLSFEEYAARQFTPIGPVPILYMDLLTGD